MSDFMPLATIFVYTGAFILLSCTIIEFSKYVIETFDEIGGNVTNG